MSPRRNPVLLGVAILCAALGCARREPLNVILIVVDTLRADHLSIYGYDRSTSPRLEEWGERAVVFEHAFATSPWTLPSFGSILTGLEPSAHFAGSRSGGKQWPRAALDSKLETLPEVLKDHGYDTGAIVANPFLRHKFGTARGFETYDYKRGRTAVHVVNLALKWLDKRDQRRFFLMLHFIDPHLPYRTLAPFAGRFQSADDDRSFKINLRKIRSDPAQVTEVDRKSIVDRYDEQIAFLDHEIGRLLTELEDRELLGRTLVLLTSDHGEELFEHGRFEHGHAMYQEVLRIPLLLWGPGARSGREVCPVSLIDIVPTVLDAAQAEFQNPPEGISLWRIARANKPRPRRYLLAENMLWVRERKTLIAWPYKLTLYRKSGRLELFDLESDPGETEDLTAIKPELAEHLARALEKRLAALARRPVSENTVDLSEDERAELRALGYLD